jgi:hypothetical protein
MKIARWTLCSQLAVGAMACSPLSPTPPFHFAETAKILNHGQVSATGAVGGATFEDIGGGLGAAARARLGVLGRHEVGVEGAVLRRMNHDDPTPERPWLGPSTAVLAKLAWKTGVTDALAILAGAGVSNSATGDAVGGDLGIVGSTPYLVADSFRPYLGLRGALAVPVGRDRDEAGGVTKAIIAAAGSTWALSDRTELLFEIGWLEEWNQGYMSTVEDPDREIKKQHKPGAYIALGWAQLFN